MIWTFIFIALYLKTISARLWRSCFLLLPAPTAALSSPVALESRPVLHKMTALAKLTLMRLWMGLTRTRTLDTDFIFQCASLNDLKHLPSGICILICLAIGSHLNYDIILTNLRASSSCFSSCGTIKKQSSCNCKLK